MVEICEDEYIQKLKSVSFIELKSLYDPLHDLEQSFSDFCDDITKWSQDICEYCEQFKLTHSEIIILENAHVLSKELQLIEQTDNVLERLKTYNQIIIELTNKSNYALPNELNGQIVDIIFKYAPTLLLLKSNDLIDKKIGINRWELINNEMQKRRKIKYVDDCVTYLQKSDIPMNIILVQNNDDIISSAHILHYILLDRKQGCARCQSIQVKDHLDTHNNVHYYTRHCWNNRYNGSGYYNNDSKAYIFNYKNGEFDIYSTTCESYCAS